MSILITGGAGYIGSHTCIELLSANFDIVMLDNLYNSKLESINRVKSISQKDFPFYQCDILDTEKLKIVFTENKIDSVIHFAGLKAVGESVQKPLAYYHNNVTGFITLLNVMNLFNVKSIVFSSSATVYGVNNPSPYNEEMPTGGCTSPYGTTKYMNELILKDLAASDPDWNISILRYFNPIGAHESGKIGEDPMGIPNNLMPFITQVAIGKREVLNVFGNNYETPDGTCERDYLHVCDLAIGHIKALEHLKKGINIFNLGTGHASSVLEIVHSFENQNNVEIPYVFAPRRAGDLASFYAETQKAEQELGFKTVHDIGRMCKDSWRWQSANPNGL